MGVELFLLKLGEYESYLTRPGGRIVFRQRFTVIDPGTRLEFVLPSQQLFQLKIHPVIQVTPN